MVSNSDNNIDCVIGIDLGTRFSCVSIWRNKRFEIITDNFGNRVIPSVVSFYRSIKLVGTNALNMKDANPANTIYDIKRIIGRRMDDDVIAQVQKLVTYDIIDDESKHHNAVIQLDKHDPTLSHKLIYRPEEICAFILMEIKRIACNYLKIDANNTIKAVITVPAYFNDSQRQATLDSAKIAGLNTIKIINEPTAAALCYGLGNKKWKSSTGGNVIIYDLGAGTLDVSLMNISGGVFKTLAVSGNSHLGGEDIDYVIMNHVMIDFKKKYHIQDLEVSKLTLLKLKNVVETAKKILSNVKKTVICVDNFYMDEKLYYVLTRKKFEEMCAKVFMICMKPLDDVISSVNFTRDMVDDVILVGGSTRIPKIQKLILEYFSNTKIKKLNCTFNPDEVVSAGASIYGYIITNNEDPFTNNLMLLDITPLSLGVETLRKKMTVIIPRNTVIPITETKIFSTDADYQDAVSIKIFEGERKLTKNNFHVGTFDLQGFEKGPRGYPTILITFHIDINNILHVTAKEKKSSIQNSIEITSTWGAKGRLSKQEIENIIQESEKNEQIDMMYTMKIELMHMITSSCNSILISIKDKTFSLTKSDIKKIKSNISSHLKWVNGKDIEDHKLDELEDIKNKIAKLYSPFIVLSNKNNTKFSDNATANINAEIYGDDDDNIDGCELHVKIDILNELSDYDKQEINALKKTISDLCKNILSVINNPVSKFIESDITVMSDYIFSVNIWLYTNNANSTLEYISKIDEINKFTEDIMKKYEKQPFEKNINFTLRDELQLTCITLHSSLKSNYFSLKHDDIEKLLSMVNDTLYWLVNNQNESEEKYQEKINNINEICNSIYHNLNRINISEDVIDTNDKVSDDEDSESNDSTVDDEIVNARPNTQIRENISAIINSFPKSSSRKYSSYITKDVLLKIDINKLLDGKVFRYKNIEYRGR